MQRRSRPLSRPSHGWEVLHALPGRVRLHSATIAENPRWLAHLGAALSIHPHVKKFRTTALCGTVLLYYDPRHTKPQELIGYLESTLAQVPDDDDVELGSLDDLGTLVTKLALSFAWTFFPKCRPLRHYFILKSSRPIIDRAVSAIKARKIKVDILDLLAIFFCLARKRETAATFMIACFHLCSYLLERTKRRSKRLLTEAFSSRVQFARVLSSGPPRRVPMESLVAADVVLLEPGDEVPIDGEVVAGEAMVDRHVLTGESVPAEVGQGNKVFARSMILAGSLQVRVEKTGKETTAERIVEIITRASRAKTEAQSRGESLADSAVLPTIALSLLALSRAKPDSALAIINADYGTGIRVAAPVALLSSMACAARRGILIKDGNALETLARVRTFVFDKTGTVTNDTPEVVEITCQRDGLSAGELVAYAAAAEQRFSHPIATAIKEEARRLEVALPECSETHYHVGWGVQVVVDGEIVRVGGKRFMEKEAVELTPSTIAELEQFEDSGGMVVFVAIDDELVGRIQLRSSIRPEIFEVVEDLKRAGRRVVLLSGDSHRATRAIAEQLGIDRYYAEVLPEEKGRYIEALQAEGEKVAMIGDGINDAIALSSADVSMSLKGAADIANDVADVVFMDGSLSKFSLLLDISARFNAHVTRTFKLIAIANSICILGALFDKVSLRSAVVLNNLLNLAAAMNGLLTLFPDGGAAKLPTRCLLRDRE